MAIGSPTNQVKLAGRRSLCNPYQRPAQSIKFRKTAAVSRYGLPMGRNFFTMAPAVLDSCSPLKLSPNPVLPSVILSRPQSMESSRQSQDSQETSTSHLTENIS